MSTPRQLVAQEARAWLGTPYHHHGRIRGVGVDCAMLLAEVYQACGIVGHLDPGHYATDWHLHRSEELFLGWASANATEVQTPALGDVGIWRFGRTYSHGGIVVQVDPLPIIVHAHLPSRAVVATALHEHPFSGRAVRWFSPFAQSTP